MISSLLMYWGLRHLAGGLDPDYSDILGGEDDTDKNPPSVPPPPPSVPPPPPSVPPPPPSVPPPPTSVPPPPTSVPPPPTSVPPPPTSVLQPPAEIIPPSQVTSNTEVFEMATLLDSKIRSDGKNYPKKLLVEFQRLTGLVPDGLYGKLSASKLAEVLRRPSPAPLY